MDNYSNTSNINDNKESSLDTKGFIECANNVEDKLKDRLLMVPKEVQAVTREIRLRLGRPVIINTKDGDFFLAENGGISPDCLGESYTLSESDISVTFKKICDYSIHSYLDDIRQGFITIKGGHRAGLCGTAVIENQKLSGVRYISSINLRIARQIIGVADEIMLTAFNKKIENTLVVGAPASGKTTVLKDLVLSLSSGKFGIKRKVSVVDTRGELGAVYNGVPQNDLGPNTDVLDGYPKGEGMMIALRTLSPEIIVCDEVGGIDEINAIKESMNCGVKIIASAHSSSVNELMLRENIGQLINQRFFKNIIILSGSESPGKIQKIINV